jgi:DNA-binding NarL/FixJ family response regulator
MSGDSRVRSARVLDDIQPEVRNISIVPFSSESARNSEERLSHRRSTLVIVAKDLLFRDCMARCLGGLNRYEVVAFATVADLIATHPLDPSTSLVLLCTFGQENDPKSVQKDLVALIDTWTDASVILLSDLDEAERVHSAFQWGARGYIPTNVPLEVAISAIHVVEVGGTFAPTSGILQAGRGKTPAPPPSSGQESALDGPKSLSGVFSARQSAIAEAIRHGKANKQIAYELNIRESTVKVHLRTIMKKLNARNRTEVAVRVGDLMRD